MRVNWLNVAVALLALAAIAAALLLPTDTAHTSPQLPDLATTDVTAPTTATVEPRERNKPEPTVRERAGKRRAARKRAARKRAARKNSAEPQRQSAPAPAPSARPQPPRPAPAPQQKPTSAEPEFGL